MGRYVKGSNVAGNGFTKTAPTQAIEIPAGTTAERPTELQAGQLRFNTTLSQLEFYNGSAFVQVTGAAGGNATITRDTYIGDGTSTVYGSGGGSEDSTEQGLSFTPSADQNVLVFIDGVFQPDTSYSISGTQITFGSAPGSGTNISILHGFDTI